MREKACRENVGADNNGWGDVPQGVQTGTLRRPRQMAQVSATIAMSEVTRPSRTKGVCIAVVGEGEKGGCALGSRRQLHLNTHAAVVTRTRSRVCDRHGA